MRIWSLHPAYLDSKGLVALWREALLAKNVLEGNTKGYRNHPQLNRFKESGNAIGYINMYLENIHIESVKRGYNFNKSKFDNHPDLVNITVTTGQLDYEFKHLLNKLKKRDEIRYLRFVNELEIEPHPIFKVVVGNVENWEII